MAGQSVILGFVESRLSVNRGVEFISYLAVHIIRSPME